MTITNEDGLIGSRLVRRSFLKTATRTTVAGGWFTDFDLAGSPGAGTLNPGNTANGIVPVSGQAGYPQIDSFTGGERGYLSRLVARNSVVATARIFDRVFVAGPYAFNANTALASQPDFSARLALYGGSADYRTLEIWCETATAATGNLAVTVNYTNSAGTGSRSTGAVGIGAAQTVGRCWQLPLQAGDFGVQRIDNVQGTVATAGTFNVMLLRPIADVYIDTAGETIVQHWGDTGLPQLFSDSALYRIWLSPAGTSLGVIDTGVLDIRVG